MRYLAIDHGKKRTGLAVCDAGETIASPLTVLETLAGLIEKIAEIIETEEIEAVVIGLPLNMDDTEGSQAKLVRRFAENLKQKVGLPVLLHDERLSSFEAKQKLADAELSPAKKRKRLDAIAAAEILQSFLDKKHDRAV